MEIRPGVTDLGVQWKKQVRPCYSIWTKDWEIGSLAGNIPTVEGNYMVEGNFPNINVIEDINRVAVIIFPMCVPYLCKPPQIKPLFPTNW